MRAAATAGGALRDTVAQGEMRGEGTGEGGRRGGIPAARRPRFRVAVVCRRSAIDGRRGGGWVRRGNRWTHAAIEPHTTRVSSHGLLRARLGPLGAPSPPTAAAAVEAAAAAAGAAARHGAATPSRPGHTAGGAASTRPPALMQQLVPRKSLAPLQALFRRMPRCSRRMGVTPPSGVRVPLFPRPPPPPPAFPPADALSRRQKGSREAAVPAWQVAAPGAHRCGDRPAHGDVPQLALEEGTLRIGCTAGGWDGGEESSVTNGEEEGELREWKRGEGAGWAACGDRMHMDPMMFMVRCLVCF